jgi:hypothetical protein
METAWDRMLARDSSPFLKRRYDNAQRFSLPGLTSQTLPVMKRRLPRPLPSRQKKALLPHLNSHPKARGRNTLCRWSTRDRKPPYTASSRKNSRGYLINYGVRKIRIGSPNSLSIDLMPHSSMRSLVWTKKPLYVEFCMCLAESRQQDCRGLLGPRCHCPRALSQMGW